MPSFKRRRSINIDTGYILRLEDVAKRIDAKAATTVASMIFTGSVKPLYVAEKTGNRRGVSMTEALWLSLRHRADSVDKATTQTAEEILIGKQPSLTPFEIAIGDKKAKEREELRASGKSVEATEPTRKRRAPSVPKIEEAPPTHPVPEMEVQDAPIISPEREIEPVYPQETEPNIDSEIRLEKAENIESDNMSPSVEQKQRVHGEERSPKRIVPDEESYGGYFEI